MQSVLKKWSEQREAQTGPFFWRLTCSNALLLDVRSLLLSVFNYAGHRRTIKMKKGDTIEAFLQGCLGDLRKEFHELRGVTSEGPWLHCKPTAPWTPLNSTVDCTADNAAETSSSTGFVPPVHRRIFTFARATTWEHLPPGPFDY